MRSVFEGAPGGLAGNGGGARGCCQGREEFAMGLPSAVLPVAFLSFMHLTWNCLGDAWRRSPLAQALVQLFLSVLPRRFKTVTGAAGRILQAGCSRAFQTRGRSEEGATVRTW